MNPKIKIDDNMIEQIREISELKDSNAVKKKIDEPYNSRYTYIPGIQRTLPGIQRTQ
jgi:hypothetical protein